MRFGIGAFFGGPFWRQQEAVSKLFSLFQSLPPCSLLPRRSSPFQRSAKTKSGPQIRGRALKPWSPTTLYEKSRTRVGLLPRSSVSDSTRSSRAVISLVLRSTAPLPPSKGSRIWKSGRTVSRDPWIWSFTAAAVHSTSVQIYVPRTRLWATWDSRSCGSSFFPQISPPTGSTRAIPFKKGC